jgi:uncharacterized phage-associated protein
MTGEEFARYLLDKTDKEGIKLNAMQIQKLTYICHGFFLANGIELISEIPRAWTYGPIYPSIAFWLSANADVLNTPPSCKKIIIDEIEKGEVKSIVDFVLDHFKGWTGMELSLWTHKPGSPWERAMLRTGKLDTRLDKNEIKNYFRAISK